MHKIVVDTHVLASALLSNGYPYKVFHNIIAVQKAQLILSEAIMKEYEDVFKYSKFAKYKEFAQNTAT